MDKGYKKVGKKDGKIKYEAIVELGYDTYGKRRRIKRIHYGNRESAEIWYAELTKKYYHKGKTLNNALKTQSQTNMRQQNDNQNKFTNILNKAPSCKNAEAQLYLKQLFIEKSWLASLQKEYDKNIPGSFKINSVKFINTETLSSYDDIKLNKCITDAIANFSINTDKLNENYTLKCKITYTLKIKNNKVFINANLPNESNVYVLCTPYK